MSVNKIYGSGKCCTKENKEKDAFEAYVKEITLFVNKLGFWSDSSDFQKVKLHCCEFNRSLLKTVMTFLLQGEFNVEELKDQKKGQPMTAENIWEKGMAARRAISNLMPTYSKVLKFKILQPMVTEGEKPKSRDFDVELEVDSGGSDDSEMQKLLLKVLAMTDYLFHNCVILILQNINLQNYQDFLVNKNRAAISVDCADEEDCAETSAPSNKVAEALNVPAGFYTLFHLAIKYQVVKAPRNCKDVFILTFLLSAGARGIEAGAIVKKSRKDLDKERR